MSKIGQISSQPYVTCDFRHTNFHETHKCLTTSDAELHVKFHPNRPVRLTCTGRNTFTALRQDSADFNETHTGSNFHTELLYRI
jgi:hypothetical protein